MDYIQKVDIEILRRFYSKNEMDAEVLMEIVDIYQALD